MDHYDAEDEKEDSRHIDAHKTSFRNRDIIERSKCCGCFYCLKIFKPEEITDWWDEPEGAATSSDNQGETAVCPYCGIDSVIGSASGYPIVAEFLKQMRERWF